MNTISQSSNIFEVGKAYSFDLYPANILESVYQHVVCTGVFSYDVANMLSPDIAVIHAQVFPYLPKGIPDSPALYSYVRFRLQDGSSRVLGMPWINHDTIKSQEAQKLIVEIKSVTMSNINQVREALAANGFDDVKITVVPDLPENDNFKKTNTLLKP